VQEIARHPWRYIAGIIALVVQCYHVALVIYTFYVWMLIGGSSTAAYYEQLVWMYGFEAIGALVWYTAYSIWHCVVPKEKRRHVTVMSTSYHLPMAFYFVHGLLTYVAMFVTQTRFLSGVPLQIADAKSRFDFIVGWVGLGGSIGVAVAVSGCMNDAFSAFIHVIARGGAKLIATLPFGGGGGVARQQFSTMQAQVAGGGQPWGTT